MAEVDEASENTEAGVGAEEAIVSSEDKPQLIFNKFKSIEDAGKGYLEAQRKISSQGEELRTIKQSLKDLEEKTNIVDAIKQISQTSQSKQGPSENDYDKFVDGLGEEFIQSPKEALKKLLGVNNNWLGEVERTSKSYSDAKIAVLEKRLADYESKLEQVDPGYQKDKDMIDRLVKGGMSIKAAKEFLKDVSSEDSPITIQRSRPPITPSGGVKGGQPVKSYLSAKERAEWKKEGLTDDMINDVEEEYKANLEREALRRLKNEQ